VEDGAMRVHPARKVKLADIEKLATALRQLREENARLREALQPFAVFAEKFAAKPINNLDDRFYSIHDGTKWQAELRRSHCDTARAALAKPDRRVGQRRVKGDPRWSEYQDEYRSYHERRKQESTK
jgi:hypothetical protein